jgi:uncharacterized protein
MKRRVLVVLIVSAVAIAFMVGGCSSMGRKMLFFPTHHSSDGGLKPWKNGEDFIGYAREVDSPKNVWLLLHGNAGQASDRAYSLLSFSAEDSVYILEYPGYGNRKGNPSRESLNRAAKEAYLYLREKHPNIPVCVVGESIGSGPATSLAKVNPPPDKLVLIVPFDKLSLVAKEHVPSFLVSLALHDNWDNVEALSDYKGRVEIFGAEGDEVIPICHAKALADTVRSSKFVVIKGGHNEWAEAGKVGIRNP